MKIKNTQGIDVITMYPIAVCKCAIGQDWYTNKFTVTFVPGDCYPDYMDVDAWLTENVRGKEFNIEDALDALGQYLLKEYNPDHLAVETEVKDVLTHFPVRVSKEYR